MLSGGEPHAHVFMREQVGPPTVVVQCPEGEEGFIAFDAPELTSQLEAALVLRAGRLYGSGSHGLTRQPHLLVGHAVFVVVEVAQFTL